MSLLDFNRGGIVWFLSKTKYEGEVQLKVFRTKQQYILMTLGSSYTLITL
jgi:hypothetical protein